MRQYPNSTWSLAQIPHILLEVPEVTPLRYKILSTAKKIFLAQNEHCTQELQFNLSCKKSLNALFWISLLSSITILPIWSTPILWCYHHHPNSTIHFLLPWHHTFYELLIGKKLSISKPTWISVLQLPSSKPSKNVLVTSENVLVSVPTVL